MKSSLVGRLGREEEVGVVTVALAGAGEEVAEMEMEVVVVVVVVGVGVVVLEEEVIVSEVLAISMITSSLLAAQT
tara:strand:- start:118 stop:342 length:225 start_codon:yes stop_codon:yes gene_type:complete